jgi:hypothetical protein
VVVIMSRLRRAARWLRDAFTPIVAELLTLARELIEGVGPPLIEAARRGRARLRRRLRRRP